MKTLNITLMVLFLSTFSRGVFAGGSESYGGGSTYEITLQEAKLQAIEYIGNVDQNTFSRLPIMQKSKDIFLNGHEQWLQMANEIKFMIVSPKNGDAPLMIEREGQLLRVEALYDGTMRRLKIDKDLTEAHSHLRLARLLIHEVGHMVGLDSRFEENLNEIALGIVRISGSDHHEVQNFLYPNIEQYLLPKIKKQMASYWQLRNRITTLYPEVHSGVGSIEGKEDLNEYLRNAHDMHFYMGIQEFHGYAISDVITYLNTIIGIYGTLDQAVESVSTLFKKEIQNTDFYNSHEIIALSNISPAMVSFENNYRIVSKQVMAIYIDLTDKIISRLKASDGDYVQLDLNNISSVLLQLSDQIENVLSESLIQPLNDLIDTKNDNNFLSNPRFSNNTYSAIVVFGSRAEESYEVAKLISGFLPRVEVFNVTDRVLKKLLSNDDQNVKAITYGWGNGSAPVFVNRSTSEDLQQMLRLVVQARK